MQTANTFSDLRGEEVEEGWQNDEGIGGGGKNGRNTGERMGR